MWDWLKKQYHKVANWIGNWWKKTRWYHLILGGAIGAALMLCGNWVPLIIAPTILTGVAQFDLLLGIGTWIATIWLWSFFREGAVVLLYFTAVRVAKVICISVSEVIQWHQSNGYWGWVPIVLLAWVIWDLLGDGINKGISRLFIAKGEEHIENLKTTGDSPYVVGRLLKKIRPNLRLKRNPKPRTTKRLKVRTANPLPVEDEEPKLCQFVEEEHWTTDGKRDVTYEEGMAIDAEYYRTGKLPKDCSVHTDRRLEIDGKVYSFVDPLNKPDRAKQLWIDSSLKHGSALRNTGKSLPDGGVFIESHYGNGVSRVVTDTKIAVWRSPTSGQTHLSFGKGREYALIATNKGYMLQKVTDKPAKVSGRPFNISTCNDPEAAITSKSVWTEKYSGAMTNGSTGPKGIHLVSKGVSVDGKEISYDHRVRGITSAKVPKKWQNARFVGEVCLGKGPVTNESKVAGMLNSSLARSLQLQQENGNLIVKVIALTELDGKDLSHLPWRKNRELVTEMNRDINRINGTRVLHKVEVYPFNPKERRRLLTEAKRQGREGFVLIDPDKGVADAGFSAKLKFTDTIDGKIVAVHPLKGKSAKWAGKKAAGAFTVEVINKGKKVRINVPVNYFPGLDIDCPDNDSDAFKLAIWSERLRIEREQPEVRMKHFRASGSGGIKAGQILEAKP